MGASAGVKPSPKPAYPGWVCGVYIKLPTLIYAEKSTEAGFLGASKVSLLPWHGESSAGQTSADTKKIHQWN